MNPLNLDEITAACNAARERDIGGMCDGSVGKAAEAAYSLGFIAACSHINDLLRKEMI